ncbi:hypothetical protein JVU11DRAFT_3177 [Chiua virens]|nr:hypothetical protein JVU11DRAFT_3177 [Chiua virens]
MVFLSFFSNNPADEAYPLNPLAPLSPVDHEALQAQPDVNVAFNAWSQSASSDVPGDADAAMSALNDVSEVVDNEVPMEFETELSAMLGTLIPDNDALSLSMLRLNPWRSSVCKWDQTGGDALETSVVKKSGNGTKVMLVEVDESNILCQDMYALKTHFQKMSATLGNNFLQKKKMYQTAVVQYENQWQHNTARITELEDQNEKIMEETQKASAVLIN